MAQASAEGGSEERELGGAALVDIGPDAVRWGVLAERGLAGSIHGHVDTATSDCRLLDQHGIQRCWTYHDVVLHRLVVGSYWQGEADVCE